MTKKSEIRLRNEPLSNLASKFCVPKTLKKMKIPYVPTASKQNNLDLEAGGA